MTENILIPIRCYTCSRVIARKSVIDRIQQEVAKEGAVKTILAEHNYAYCCRIHYTTKYLNNV